MTLPIHEWFERSGGAFAALPADMVRRLSQVRAFVFDWDGVFNAGVKGEGLGSTWSEADSMGQNLLRFAWWLRDGALPITAVMTGQDNPSAVQLARREHFHVVYQGFLDKKPALDHLLRSFELEAHEVAFVFDDALDLSVARHVGLRVLVRRAASPLFERYVLKASACEYVTGREGGEHAVREVAELFLGLTGVYDDVVAERSRFGPRYAEYFAQRQAVPVLRFGARDGGVAELDD